MQSCLAPAREAMVAASAHKPTALRADGTVGGISPLFVLQSKSFKMCKLYNKNKKLTLSFFCLKQTFFTLFRFGNDLKVKQLSPKTIWLHTWMRECTVWLAQSIFRHVPAKEQHTCNTFRCAENVNGVINMASKAVLAFEYSFNQIQLTWESNKGGVKCRARCVLTAVLSKWKLADSYPKQTSDQPSTYPCPSFLKTKQKMPSSH